MFSDWPYCNGDRNTPKNGLIPARERLPEHKLAAETADDAIDEAKTEERTEALPVPLPRCI